MMGLLNMASTALMKREMDNASGVVDALFIGVDHILSQLFARAKSDQPPASP
jgi:hypothetical protein